MTSTVTVIIDLGWGQSLRETRPISDNIVRKAYSKLDFPSPNAGIAALFCTDPGTIRTVMAIRKDAASLIAKEISRALLDTMTAKDTLMGYPIERVDPPQSSNAAMPSQEKP